LAAGRHLHAGIERGDVGADDLLTLLRELPLDRAGERVARQIQCARQDAHRHDVLREGGAGFVDRQLLEWHARHAGLEPLRERYLLRRRLVHLVDENEGVVVGHELGAEPAVVGPVEGDEDVEIVALRLHGPRRQPHPDRRFTAADLRAEGLDQHAEQPFPRGHLNQQLTGGHHAVATGAGDAYDEVISRHATFPSIPERKLGNAFSAM
jgi:hypothetical protein